MTHQLQHSGHLSAALASLLFVVIFSFEVEGGSYPVVDTGQSACYDAAGYKISCPAPGESCHGQDGQIDGHQPAYRDNGDGTVTDLVTGLMWEKSFTEGVTWPEAVSGAAAARTGGHSDWRLPTIKELYSLILFSGTDPSRCMRGRCDTRRLVPFLDPVFDFEYPDARSGARVIDAQYWSATEYVSTTMDGQPTVFGVNFADGRIKGYPRDRGPRGRTATHYARYVRGAPGYGINQYGDNNDGTLTDQATGLMWCKSDSGHGMSWEEALAWVQERNAADHLGYDDWRLPNAKELQSIVDYSRAPAATGTAAIDPLFEVTKIHDEAGQINAPFYWTSTTHGASDGRGPSAVYIAFGEALGWMRAGPRARGARLLDVHGAGAQRSDPKIGDPSTWPRGRGPQGDVVRVLNLVRLVRTATRRSVAVEADDPGPSTTPAESRPEHARSGSLSGAAPTGGDEGISLLP